MWRWKKKALSTVVTISITVAALYFLLNDEIILRLRELWPELKWHWIALSIAIGPLAQYARAWRFSILVTGRADLPSFPMFQVAVYLNFFNYVLPFRIGEISFPLLVKRYFGQNMAKSTGILLIVRVLDLLIVVAIGSLALMFINNEAGPVSGALLLFATIVAFSIIVAFALLKGRYFTFEIRNSGIQKLYSELSEGAVTVFERHRILPYMIATVVLWVTIFSICHFSFLTVTDTVSLDVSILSGAAATASFALPVNGIAGIGPTQAAWVAAAYFAGHEWALSVASAIVFGAIILVNALLQAAVVAVLPTAQSARA